MSAVSRQPVSGRELVCLLAAVGLAACLRGLLMPEPWSGLPKDFHTAFGAYATGGPVRNFFERGILSEGGMPYLWSIELAGGGRSVEHYLHHPAGFMWLCALALKLFGPAEWALRLVPALFSVAAVVAVWALVRELLGSRAGLVAALVAAACPYLAHYGPQPWTESALVATGSMALLAMWRWVVDGRLRWAAAAAAWTLAGGLLDWPMHFFWIGPLAYAVARRSVRTRPGFWSGAALVPAAAALSIAVHALHMRLVVPHGAMAADTGGTLARVLAWPSPWTGFLADQLAYVIRFGGHGFCLLALVGTLGALGGVGRREGRADPRAYLAFLWLPGLLYVVAFPGRSHNHDFFGMLAVPGLAACAALGVLVLSRVNRELAVLALLAAGVHAMWCDVFQWWQHRSDQVAELVAAPWLSPVLEDDRAVILTHVGRGMALPFYARAQLVPSVDDLETLERREAQIVSRLPEGVRAYYLLDTRYAALLPDRLRLVEALATRGVNERHETPHGEFVLVELQGGP